jgi:SAM-dependent methyltransferase
MRTDAQEWDKVFRKEGRIFSEPFQRFPEIVRTFQERGCSRLLDLGCGSGRHVVHLAREGFRVHGTDVSPTGLRMTRVWLAEEGLAAGVVLADMREPLPFSDGAFEGLLSTQVIHHAPIATVRGTIREIWRVLASGGLAFVTVSADAAHKEGSREIEAGTFVPLSGPEAGLPHHIFSKEELRTEFQDFYPLETSLQAEGKVLAILAQKP